MRQADKIVTKFSRRINSSVANYLERTKRNQRLTPPYETVDNLIPAVENVAFTCLLAQ
jgi:hypothetical protein